MKEKEETTTLENRKGRKIASFQFYSWVICLGSWGN